LIWIELLQRLEENVGSSLLRRVHRPDEDNPGDIPHRGPTEKFEELPAIANLEPPLPELLEQTPETLRRAPGRDMGSRTVEKDW
jgi:hypothetical protein